MTGIILVTAEGDSERDEYRLQRGERCSLAEDAKRPAATYAAVGATIWGLSEYLQRNAHLRSSPRRSARALANFDATPAVNNFEAAT
ncbi:MAG: hypothetical protein FD148_526 [Methylocystaceae bacterium]|nr:MAG: hypothetical protein FD148_526 [Methylocystaceae bacterium]